MLLSRIGVKLTTNDEALALVADHDSTRRRLIASTLRGAGCSVVEAADSREAVVRIECERDSQRRFDVVVCCLGPAEFDGVDVLAACRTLHRKTRVIFTTDAAHPMRGLVLKLGALLLEQSTDLEGLCAAVRHVEDACPA